MNDTSVGRMLHDGLDALGPHEAPAGFADTAIRAASAVAQRRPLLPILDTRAWPPRRGSAADPTVRRVGALVVVALLLVALIAVALTASRRPALPVYLDRFVTTGPIPGDLRSTWPATLADGRVLVIGGWPGESNTATNMASVLDPATGVFTRTGDMVMEHDNGVPLALDDGRALVVAGMRNAADPDSGNTPPIATTELYDPRTGTFRLTDPLSSPRYAMAVVRLRDGRVLVAGGAECLGPEPCAPGVDAADVYDPTTERFTVTGRMALPMAAAAVARLPDGQVMIVGQGIANDPGEPGPAVTQIYDPATGTFRLTASPTRPCDQIRVAERRDAPPLVLCSQQIRRPQLDEHGDPVLHRGEVQWEDVLAPSTVEAYDPATDRFTFVGTLPYPADIAHERLDGRIVVVGRKRGGYVVAGQEPWAGLLDPATGLTQLIDPPSRSWPLSVGLPDGRVVLVGGDDPVTGRPMTNAEILE